MFLDALASLRSALFNDHYLTQLVTDLFPICKISDFTNNYKYLLLTANTHYDESVYENNPPNYPDLLINTRYPYNAEARLSELTENWQTPIGKHFVRNHCAVPDINPEVIQYPRGLC